MPRSFAYRGRRVRTDPFLVVAENVRNDGTGEQAQSTRRSAELEGKHRRSKAVLLEKGGECDILRREVVAVACRVEMIVAANYPTVRPASLWATVVRSDRLD
jgi:hypothetical protein